MSRPPRALDAPAVVVLAGIAAAVHVGKLPPAVLALQQSMGISLVQAGFLLSLVQIGGMTLGLVAGVFAERTGLRRSMLVGLALLTLAGFAGAWARTPADLLALRAVESVGLLLTTVPAPGLLRRTVAPGQLTRVLGVWGAYMPFGTALALLVGPLVIGQVGWRVWWVVTAAGTAAMWIAVWWRIPTDTDQPPPVTGASGKSNWSSLLSTTLRAPGPWLGALAFGLYALQWLAVIGFLPTLYGQLGWDGVAIALSTALVAAVNIIGNVAAGHLLHRGVRVRWLLWAGFLATGLGGSFAFGLPGHTLPMLSLGGALLFSLVGGLIPGSLFGLVPRLTPPDGAISSTVGWMQQWTSIGQVVGPPLVAWVASLAGGWQLSWVVIGACSVLGFGFTWQVERHQRALPGASVRR